MADEFRRLLDRFNYCGVTAKCGSAPTRGHVRQQIRKSTEEMIRDAEDASTDMFICPNCGSVCELKWRDRNGQCDGC